MMADNVSKGQHSMSANNKSRGQMIVVTHRWTLPSLKQHVHFLKYFQSHQQHSDLRSTIIVILTGQITIDNDQTQCDLHSILGSENLVNFFFNCFFIPDVRKQ